MYNVLYVLRAIAKTIRISTVLYIKQTPSTSYYIKMKANYHNVQ